MDRNSLKYISWKLRKKIVIDLKTIYCKSNEVLNALYTIYELQRLKFVGTYLVERSYNDFPSGVSIVKCNSIKSSQLQKEILLK